MKTVESKNKVFQVQEYFTEPDWQRDFISSEAADGRHPVGVGQGESPGGKGTRRLLNCSSEVWISHSTDIP